MPELTTPKIRTDHRLAAEFRPKKVEPWLENLPRADRDACIRRLCRALAAQNRVALAPDTRLQLMELYLAPFREIHTAHHADLNTIARIPLHPHYRAKQELLIEFLEALATGCKIAVLGFAEQRRGQARSLNLALALHRSVYYLGQVIVTSFELYSRPPSGSWRDLHELYRCAEEEKLLELEIQPIVEDSGPADVLSAYLPTLLVGACQPLALLPGDARRLHDLAPQWYSTMKITKGLAKRTGPGYFRLNLKSDLAPLPMSKSSRPFDADSRLVRTLNVAKAMHEALVGANDSSNDKPLFGIRSTGDDQGELELFRRVGRILGEVNITRGSKRFEAGTDIDLCCGFEAVFSCCVNDGRPAPEDARSTVSDQSQTQFIDLSEPMLGVPIPGVKTDSRIVADAFSGDDGPCRARAVNQSAGGMCVVLLSARGVRIKVGDIAAHRFVGASEWELGTIRWMRVGPREIRFGVQLLGPQVVPVTLTPIEAEAVETPESTERPVRRGFWLPENTALKQPSSLLLPRFTEPHAMKLRLRAASPDSHPPMPGQIRLAGRLDRTGDYERFVVSADSPETER